MDPSRFDEIKLIHSQSNHPFFIIKRAISLDLIRFSHNSRNVNVNKSSGSKKLPHRVRLTCRTFGVSCIAGMRRQYAGLQIRTGIGIRLQLPKRTVPGAGFSNSGLFALIDSEIDVSRYSRPSVAQTSGIIERFLAVDGFPESRRTLSEHITPFFRDVIQDITAV